MDMTDAQSLNHMTADGLCKVKQSKVSSELQVRSKKRENFCSHSIRSYYTKLNTLVTTVL
jgi:hypothetical protein